MLVNQTRSQFEATYNPKVPGTINLHRETINFCLEHIVVFSSLAALIGNVGQSNHSSEKAFEDAFIHYRHSLGLPGTTINWGLWAEMGIVKHSSVFGLIPVSASRMLTGLQMTLRSQTRHLAICQFDSFVTVAQKFAVAKGYIDVTMDSEQNMASNQSNHLALDHETLRMELNATANLNEKISLMGLYLRSIIKSVLWVEDEPRMDTSIPSLGIDSLMSIELTNFIKKLLRSDVELTSTLFQEYPTIEKLAEGLINRMTNRSENNTIEAMTPLTVLEMHDLLVKDSMLPSDIAKMINLQPVGPCRASEIKNVLVTGATGRLGSNIFAESVRGYPNVQAVCCLVRDDEKASGIEKLASAVALSYETLDTSKLVFVGGDITAKHNLGIESEQEYKLFCEKIDASLCSKSALHRTCTDLSN